MDYKEIQQQFDKVLKTSQGVSSVNTDELFENWYRAKESFIKKFNNQLIYEVGSIEVHLDDIELKEYVLNMFMNKARKIIGYESMYDNFFRYVEDNYQDFATNILHQDWKLSEEKTIPMGMKFTKSFKYFLSNEKMLNDVQMLASEITQKCKISGILCLSVHPLDYLSISENCHSWRSCHALNGEFRTGNLSYMQDSSTIVCYIKSSEGDVFTLPRFPEDVPWNSKKWRMLLFVSDNQKMIFAGRQYPFSSMSAMQEVYNTFIDLFTQKRELWFGDYEKDFWIKWQNTYIEDITYPDGDGMELYARYVPTPGYIIRMKELISDVVGPSGDEEEDPLHYNDLLRSTCYTKPYYSFYKFANAEPQHFTIGSAVKCIKCGKEYLYGEHMVCEHCMCEERVIDTDLSTPDPRLSITLETNDIAFDVNTLPSQEFVRIDSATLYNINR